MVAERTNTAPFRGGVEGAIFWIIISLQCGDLNPPQLEEGLESGEAVAFFVIPWDIIKR